MPTISGTVYDDAGAPAAGRIVRVYRRDTGALLGKTITSDGLPVAGDPHYANVSLLLHCDGADNSTVFTDSSAAPKTVTAYGNAKISTAQSKFGGASGYFDGTDDYLRVEIGDGANFGSGDFTVEAMIYSAAATGGGDSSDKAIFGGFQNNPDVVFFLTNNSLAPSIWDQNALHTSSISVPALSWTHVAWARASGTLRIFVNGVLGLTASTSVSYTMTTYQHIGGSPESGSRFFNGYIDDLRITKGVARYTANFTPPTAPHYDRLPADATPAGSYGITTAYAGEIQRIVLDDDAGDLYNDLIDRVVLA